MAAIVPVRTSPDPTVAIPALPLRLADEDPALRRPDQGAGALQDDQRFIDFSQ
jgi:hypothetical protein